MNLSIKAVQVADAKTYYEMKYQLELDVLLKPEEYYNAFVGGKIHRKHILGLQSFIIYS